MALTYVYDPIYGATRRPFNKWAPKTFKLISESPVALDIKPERAPPTGRYRVVVRWPDYAGVYQRMDGWLDELDHDEFHNLLAVKLKMFGQPREASSDW